MRIELYPSLGTAGHLAAALGAVLTGDERTRIKGIATHSAEVEAGDLFVAAKGEKKDGAAYVSDALARGAVGVLSTPDIPVPSARALFFAVEDPIAALCRAAACRRAESHAFLIAISGSVGKTTVKEAVATVLEEKGDVAKSGGNFNSQTGFPLSLLSFPECDFHVAELGINHVGEMDAMARAAAPDLAVLTNVGTAHIGGFGSYPTLLAEKAKLAAGLRGGGRLLAPVELSKGLFPCAREQILTWGNHRRADFRLENLVMGEKGVSGDLHAPDAVITNLSWPVSGRIGADTLLTVSATCLLAGCSEEQLHRGLLRAAEGMPRMKTVVLGSRLLIDDTYNASPEAVLNAVEVLRYRAQGRPTVAVLGDMLELGRHSVGLHRAVGAGIAKAGVSMLFAYGDAARYYADGARGAGMPGDAVFIFGIDEQKALVRAVCRDTPQNAVVLFKGSGKMKMGELIRATGAYYA